MRDSNCGALGDVPFQCVGGVFCIAAVFWSSHVSRKVNRVELAPAWQARHLAEGQLISLT